MRSILWDTQSALMLWMDRLYEPVPIEDKEKLTEADRLSGNGSQPQARSATQQI